MRPSSLWASTSLCSSRRPLPSMSALLRLNDRHLKLAAVWKGHNQPSIRCEHSNVFISSSFDPDGLFLGVIVQGVDQNVFQVFGVWMGHKISSFLTLPSVSQPWVFLVIPHGQSDCCHKLTLLLVRLTGYGSRE